MALTLSLIISFISPLSFSSLSLSVFFLFRRECSQPRRRSRRLLRPRVLLFSPCWVNQFEEEGFKSNKYPPGERQSPPSSNVSTQTADQHGFLPHPKRVPGVAICTIPLFRHFKVIFNLLVDIRCHVLLRLMVFKAISCLYGVFAALHYASKLKGFLELSPTLMTSRYSYVTPPGKTAAL